MTRMPKPDVCQPSGSAELAMLDVYMPMMKSSAIISAGRLGLFEALARGPLSIPQLAETIQSSIKGTAALADFLIALGYLEKQGGLLANTESTQRWFTSLGQVDYTPGLLWTHEAWPMMGGLAEAVRSGHPERTLWDAMVEHSHLGELFSSYMAAFASDLGRLSAATGSTLSSSPRSASSGSSGMSGGFSGGGFGGGGGGGF